MPDIANCDRSMLSLILSKPPFIYEIAKNKRLSEKEINDCYIIGYNHDIGYEFANNKLEHNIVGGEFLRNAGFKYWKEVYYHGEINIEYNSVYLDILNQADMQIDKFGNDVGYDRRLEDIKNRYGENSIVYEKCLKLVHKNSSDGLIY